MSNEAVKRALGIASRVFAWIMVIVTVGMMVFTIFSTATFDRNDRNLFGIRFYIVLSDSMSLSENNKDDDVHFNAGDIVLIKNVKDARALQAGEVIAFISQNEENFGETVTHMIREVKTQNGKVIGYVTYGTNTGKNDEALVEPEYVLGTYSAKLPRLGYFFNFLKTTPGYIIFILVPFLLLILWQGVNVIRLFKQYKREQMADMEAERAQIAQEREETARMMRELQAMREQLAQQVGDRGIPTPETATEPTSHPDGEADSSNQTNP
ncbi:MAG: signal peptidase I [Clostridia bacterium]|nr:signal peptidase I [Clostridia bacterium]MBR7111931.1 signal peptidase I [Clostridia bacterium]